LEGDGLDAQARWLDERLDPLVAAGPLQFPRGVIVVKSSGNEGDPADRQFAKITVPAGGEITVPIELADNRVGFNQRFNNCVNALHSPPFFFTMWYRRNFDVVRFAVRLPNQAGFSGDMTIGGNLDNSFVFRPPSLVPVLVGAGANRHRVIFLHGTEAGVPHPAGGTVRRHSGTLIVLPKVSAGTVTYADGIYEVRIRAPAGTELFAMGDFGDWGSNFAFFRIATTMANGAALPAGIDVTSEFTAIDTLGRHAITVAAYDDATHELAPFSSRGPLRDFSDPAAPKGVIIDKPDLAAPGVDINAAQSQDTSSRPVVPTAAFLSGIRFVEFQGTSMSTPFVAGLVALMLDKKNDLNITEARTALQDAAVVRKGELIADLDPPPALPDRFKNAYGAGPVHGLESHKRTP
jgi:subtilisin family serine protease